MYVCYQVRIPRSFLLFTNSISLSLYFTLIHKITVSLSVSLSKGQFTLAPLKCAFSNRFGCYYLFMAFFTQWTTPRATRSAAVSELKVESGVKEPSLHQSSCDAWNKSLTSNSTWWGPRDNRSPPRSTWLRHRSRFGFRTDESNGGKKTSTIILTSWPSMQRSCALASQSDSRSPPTPLQIERTLWRRSYKSTPI